jgi:hypothetical protein
MLQTLGEDPARAEALAQQLAGLHAALHEHGGAGLPPQREHLIRRINLGPLPARNKSPVLAAMRGLAEGTVLCHGDFHPGNVIMTATGPRIIDWYDATSGNPAGDFARTCLMLQYSRLPGTAEGSARQVVEAMRERFLMPTSSTTALAPPLRQCWSNGSCAVCRARIAEPILGPGARITLLRVIDSLLAQA